MTTKTDKKPAAKPQDGLHIVMRPIKYHGTGPHAETRVVPGDRLLLEFSHLEDDGYALLLRKRVLAPATAADVKAYKEAEKARREAETDRETIAREAIERRAREKASAMAKQLKTEEELEQDLAKQLKLQQELEREGK